MYREKEKVSKELRELVTGTAAGAFVEVCAKEMANADDQETGALERFVDSLIGLCHMSYNDLLIRRHGAQALNAGTYL